MTDQPVKKAPLGALVPKMPPVLEKFEAREEPNAKWEDHHKGRLITLKRKVAFSDSDQWYLIGSCFAERIRMGLAAATIKVGPNYKSVRMNPDRYRIDELPKRPHMNYYNTFAIRQEFERTFGEWTQASDDYWTLPKDFIWGSDKPIYQDPYRRGVFARTPEDLFEAIGHVNRIMDEGIRDADVVFMTMGLAEVFINKQSGLVACQRPAYKGGGGEKETSFYMSSFQENYANMKKVAEIIHKLRPDARIIATVSPVGIARTFSGNDVFVATMENKAILRAVLGQLDREGHLTYFPSYDITTKEGPNAFYESDGRHVNPWVISNLVKLLQYAHRADYDPNAHDAMATAFAAAETAPMAAE